MGDGDGGEGGPAGLAAAVADLLAVTDETMQPTTVSLWLRPRR